MGGGACVVIINGNDLQGEAHKLISTAIASCQLVDYLENDEDVRFDPADMQPIIDFHLKAIERLTKLDRELDGINRALAAKYNRPVS